MKKILGDKHPRQVLLFDPGCSSENLGDLIISKAARSYIEPFFSDDFIIRLSTHQKNSFRYRRLLNQSKIGFVLGSNLLKGGMLLGRRQWEVSLLDTLQLGNIVLLGCGWGSYDSKPDLYSSALYRRLLSSSYLHSVRDDFTKQQMEAMGFKNVINTGCPSLWGLSPEFCQSIPQGKAPAVLLTVSSYNKDARADRQLFQLAKELYGQVYFWPQGNDDRAYAEALGVLDGCRLLPASLESYEDFLDATWVDYAGTRLHGGICALLHGRRSVIISIDNRAREMGRDFGLKTCERSAINELGPMLSGDFSTQIRLDYQAIHEFLGQFEK